MLKEVRMDEASQLNNRREISPLSVGQIYLLSNPLLRKPLTERPSPDPKSIVGKNGRGVRSE
jgi:hypothetical protein